MFNRGQMTAPFELLVTVIIMAFVIIVGANMLTGVNDQVCLNHVGSEMSEFVTALEETANNKTTSKFIFFPEQICFDEDEHIMNIVREDDIKVCSAKCGIPKSTCFRMIFYSSDVALGYTEKCLNLPTYTTFATDPTTCMTIDDVAGYDVVTPQEKIPFGNYVLKNVSAAGDTWPTVCFYQKKG